ncbi:glycosyl transferase, partial [Myxococcota bacterium]|nr:glycosyl transferase [Myxococcota bacterium]
HTESRFHPDTLRLFVAAYQTVCPLTTGELWAIATSLRIVLIENLRRLADGIVRRQAQRAQADALAEVLLDPHPRWVPWRLWWLGRAATAPAFATRLVQRLNDRDPETTPGRVWLDQQLARQGTTTEETIRRDHLDQVGAQGPVRDGITSLRDLSAVDWGDFVEGVSLVEAALRDGAPAHELDFATRDHYRHAVEDLARHSGWTELAVAQEAVARARIGLGRESDAGYSLISGGRPSLQAAIGYRARWSERVMMALPFHATTRYFGGIMLGTAVALALPLGLAGHWGASAVELVLFGVLALIPASELAVAVVNRLVCRLRAPRKLPKLALEGGVPAGLRTLVAVPTLLTDAAEVEALLDRLEVHYLANDDAHLRFALVTDWCDAATERLEGDDALLTLAREGVAALNARYGSRRFFVLHRTRRWNERQGRWMGWERKRGKLHELNRLLRGATDTSFVGGEIGDLGVDVRFVITLDSDTRLPHGAARKLVGAITHPLNRPVHDPLTGRVVQGYGILQPRITPTLPDAGGTLTQRIFSGQAGLDPYAFAISDVYQDLFDEGSFTGKGIYDVDAFEKALAGHVPDNTLLSHDLLEGLYARAGMLTDVELFEAYPATYAVASGRQHRWARGDWQLLPWIFARGSIPAIGRWKMLDNLRRTLVPPTLLATLVAAWAMPGGRAGLWTVFVLATLTLPVLMPLALDVLPRRSGLSKWLFIRGVGGDLGLAFGRIGLGLALLVVEARRMTDAITRTLYRMASGRGPMLEWVTAAEAALTSRLRARDARRWLLVSLALAASGLVAVAVLAPQALPWATPFLLLWGPAPAIVSLISAPPRVHRRSRLDAADADLLRLTARRTWRYFETFVTVDDHDLPPDNVQEDPQHVVAHRTSPTNIGLYLLSAVAAHDMGWLGTAAFVVRVESTFATLDQLERHRGHFLNWYDTASLAPLVPRYVSTVDSGNLAGHLIALQQACLEVEGPTPARRRDGVADALALTREAILRAGDDQRDGAVRRRHLDETASELAVLLAAGARWDALADRANALLDIAHALADQRGDTYAETLAWAGIVRRTIEEHAQDAASPELAGRLARLAERAERFSRDMDWGFLFDESKRLFATGFRVSDGRLDAFSYDLLASECRLASFLAIARGEVPVSHWFRLGRRVVPLGARSALISWSGSMFEYLMPSLVMAAPTSSLLATTDRVVVASQIRYGAARGVPWGNSESAYNARDLNLTYQYGNFGLPSLGVKRGLAEDLVVAAYSTALAAMVDPVAAARNLGELVRLGASGPYGFYEAVDFTGARLPDGVRYAVVKAYFAHHQGMSVVALCNALDGFPMRRRFHAAPIVRATELLLHERPPRDVVVVSQLVHPHVAELHVTQSVPQLLRQFASPHGAFPVTQRLSNGRYSVAITAAGAGQSLFHELAVTRWREDPTLDACGSFVFVRDVDSGKVWSAGHQPTGVDAREYQASFYEHRVEIRRHDGSIVTQLDVVLATEDDAEIRRVTITNHGLRARTFDLTSYAELVLAPQAADDAHPAFSNLFVETFFEPSAGAILATRRPRSSHDVVLWAAHTSAVHGVPSEGVQFETDRARFIGRGHQVRTASAAYDGHPLSNTVGTVLDPIFSLRRRITVAPGQTAEVVFATLVGGSRERLVALCDAYHDAGMFERTVAQAWTHSQVQLRDLGLDADEAQLFQRLGSHVLYADPSMRAPQSVLLSNRLGQADLWRLGISGDRPILLARIQDGDDAELVRQLVHAHCYWRVKALAVDLVLLNEQVHTYGGGLQGDLAGLVRRSHLAGLTNGVHVLRSDELSDDDRALLLSAARVVVQSRDGTLAEQVRHRMRDVAPPSQATPPAVCADVPQPRLELDFWNGIGGFSKNGRDYVTRLGAGQWTPVPWINVIANPNFGFLISESGSGFTWSENSHENQLTPWSNDPV